MSFNLEAKNKISDRYKELSQEKNFYLQSAKECCKYTLPILLCFFEEGAKNWENINAPYQSIGARGINNLASKLLTAITPINTPMFRLIIDDEVMKDELTGGDIYKQAEIEEILSEYTSSVHKAIKASGDYAQMYEVWQLLLVSGNVLIYDPDDNSNIRVYSLRDYVLKRDRSGQVTEIIIKESVKLNSLPLMLQEKIKSSENLSNNNLPSNKKDNKSYDLYTEVVRIGEFFYLRQECAGIIIEESKAKYPKDACPYIPIRMYAGSGEDYSRSFVSNYLGDLKTVETLCKGSAAGAAMAAKHIYLVRPDGLTEINDIEETDNGGVIYGRAEDVNILQSGKSYDLRLVSDEASKIEKRLSQAFLLFDNSIRNAERVTSTEIRTVARELESTLGGVYSVMCHSFQLPYIKRKIWKLQQLGKIKPLNNKIVPVVVTGFEALGLNGDKDKLLEFASLLNQVFGKDAISFIDYEIFIKRLAASVGIDLQGLIKNNETLSEEINKAKKEELIFKLVEKLIPTIINKAENLQHVIDNMLGAK